MNGFKRFSHSFLLFLAVLLNPQLSHADKLPLKELEAFSQAFYKIKANYALPVSDEQLIKAAINGMVDSLDRHSKYLTKTQFQAFLQINSGEQVGVGIELTKHKFGAKIINVLENSPAEKAGIKSEMLITKIDGKAIKGFSSYKSSRLLQGEIGSQVLLTVTHADGSSAQKYPLKRQQVLIKSVTSQRLPHDTGYIGISQFTFKSIEEFNVAIDAMSAQNPLKRLIIDLRNNPGGSLDVALELSNLFIDDGKLLISNGNSEEAQKTYYATKDAPLNYLDVVVVINAGSASASEIFAIALRDHKKAIILGEKSYGKGSIQSIFPLSDGSGMKLTTAEYRSPLGKKIQDTGVVPDVKFEIPKKNNRFKVSLLDDPELLQAYYLLSE